MAPGVRTLVALSLAVLTNCLFCQCSGVAQMARVERPLFRVGEFESIDAGLWFQRRLQLYAHPSTCMMVLCHGSC
ncbi:MAG TPA: hypothetical protein V6C72_17240, partial [Chroococcales cyanobacterium]